MSPEEAGLLATYNEWMNAKLYEAAARLSADELMAERGAFFGSIFGTLNHLVVADTVWLKRIAQAFAHFKALDPVRALAMPAALDQQVFDDLPAMLQRRTELDAVLKQWVASITVSDLGEVLEYTSMKGVVSRKRLGLVLMHVFNHQTHHRGQATTLLFQAGQDVGVTDLLVRIPNED
jgi:uncharacterized damage-inducible protein DinB